MLWSHTRKIAGGSLVLHYFQYGNQGKKIGSQRKENQKDDAEKDEEEGKWSWWEEKKRHYYYLHHLETADVSE
ncbi:hypothetical protein E2C01_053730 [Portunus trituberculatus]|uniref:Uncharacterized protein n=1 Tax=Portunus trituberculatus TaxID=210409 RepID=A0A5B7GQ49_PORTR|nr:hypothetical protein [Portunus trituberculatus]